MTCEHKINPEDALCVDCYDRNHMKGNNPETCKHESKFSRGKDELCLQCWTVIPKPLGVFVKEEIKTKDGLV